jgi:hypothetical protein
MYLPGSLELPGRYRSSRKKEYSKMNKNIRNILSWLFAAGAAVGPLEKVVEQTYSQPSNPAPTSAPIMPGRMEREHGEVYNFSGKIRNVLDSTAIAGAELTFINPEGIEYTEFVANIPRQTRARFKVYHVLGQELTDVVFGPMDGDLAKGQYQLNIDLKSKTAGVYFAVLETPEGIISQL